MTNKAHEWELLQRVLNDTTSSPALPRALVSSMVRRIEEALGCRAAQPVSTLDRQLTELAQYLLSKAPEDVINYLRSESRPSGSIGYAFEMGQVSFAQQLVSHAAAHRTDDAFVDTLKSERFRKYIAALLQRERTNSMLGDLTGDNVATVSRKLAELREIGVTDFRKQGTKAINFLTPIAKAAAVQILGFSEFPVAKEINERSAKIEKSISRLPSYMQKAQSFSQTQTPR